MRLFRSLVVVVLLAPLAACSDGCDNQVVSRKGAPGGRLSAVMFERSCGATTGFTTQISLLRPGEVPAGKGEVFIADDNHGAAIAGRWGGPWAGTEWLGPDRLLIRHAGKARIFLRREEASGVRITYQALNN